MMGKEFSGKRLVKNLAGQPPAIAISHTCKDVEGLLLAGFYLCVFEKRSFLPVKKWKLKNHPTGKVSEKR